MGGFDIIDERFTSLHERAVAVLGDDVRVKAVEVSGSLGAGTADEWSDLYLQIVATDHTGHRRGLVARRR